MSPDYRINWQMPAKPLGPAIQPEPQASRDLIREFETMGDGLTKIAPDACLLDVDESAWRSVVEHRGGCNCCISPPCNACVEPITEEELNAVGYTYGEAP
jgi:hypothetical protein